MLEAIHGARKSIFLESFILTDDEVTHHFFQTLKEKAEAGVKIKIIIDQVGHFWYGSVNKKELEKAGAEILFFNRWLYRSHRKVLIVDEEAAFLGGVNIRGEYAKWLDLHVRLTGGLLLKPILRSFAKVYELAGGNDAEVARLGQSGVTKARASIYRAKTWLIEHWPIRGQSVLRDYYKKKCRGAKKSIVIVTPYFVPHRWLIKSLRAAANRGVAIDIIVPGKTDLWLFDIAHRVFVKNLSGIIRFYFLPEMNHAKVLLVDDAEGLVGSNNIDAQSFDFNLEAGIIFQRKDVVGDIKVILAKWKAMAVPADPAGFNKWYHKVVEFIIRILQPIL